MDSSTAPDPAAQQPAGAPGPATDAHAAAPPVSDGRGIATATVGGLVILLLVVLLPAVWPHGSAQLPADPVGASAPDFSLSGLGSTVPVRLSALRGRPVVLNFWASWCAPCVQEATALAEGERRWRDRGVIFIGVNTQDTTAAASEFLSNHGIAYRNVVDPTGDVLLSYGVTAFPETFFIDAAGTIRAKEIAPLDQALLDQSIGTIIGL